MIVYKDLEEIFQTNRGVVWKIINKEKHKYPQYLL